MKFKAPIEVESSLVDSSNSSGSAGQVLTSTGVGVDWIDPTLLPAESAGKVIQTVRFGEAVSKGDPLVITGYHGSTGPAIVERADATDATKMPAYGVALEDYANNATGLMIAVGDFNDFDTSSYSVGDTLYVAVGGGMTNVKPTGTALIQNMGIVSRSNANNGDVEIVAIGRTNDVPNLPLGRLFVGTSANTSLTSDVVYIDDANDRVGIGTTSPGAKLDVAGLSIFNGAQLRSTDDGTTLAGFIGNRSGWTGGGLNNDLAIGAYTSNICFFTNNSVGERMRITSGGNVGIGNFAPTNKLIVETSVNTADGIISRNLNSGSSAYSFIGTFNNTNNGVDLRSYPSANATYPSTSLISSSSGQTGGLLIMQNGANPIRFNTNGSERMRILSSGNVGIGTTSPGAKLEVVGGHFWLNGRIKIYEGADMCFIADPGSGTFSLGDITGLADTAYIEGDGSEITIINKGVITLTATYNNKIGIGTTTPGYPLHVAGDTSGTSIYATADIVAYSDQSVKENIRPIENVIERVQKSRGVLYDRIDSESKDNIGFIAQELEVAFPELVVTNEDGTKAVKYQNAVAVLFEAVKEQQKQINEIKRILNGLTN